jgi:preprotein translocase subunit SecE
MQMAKEQSFAMNLLIREFFQGGLYKRNQGRVTRQVTFAALATGFALGTWRLMVYLDAYSRAVQYLIPAAILLVGLWVSYRVVNLPRFADFLIAVEAEMNKVSWPTRDVLFRSTFVVMFTIFALAVILFLYDLLWSQLLHQIGVT